MSEMKSNDYIDKVAIRILRCNKIEVALLLANEIVRDAQRGAIKEVRAEGYKMYDHEAANLIPRLINAIKKSVPF